MAESMVEQVARALLDVRENRLAFRSDTTPVAWETVPQWHNELLDDARAAIAAMREPTTEMIEEAIGTNTDIRSPMWIDGWRAMIDAALAETAGQQK